MFLFEEESKMGIVKALKTSPSPALDLSGDKSVADQLAA
jgi:hypothetical protein